MTSKREQFYKRRIAELEAQLKQRDHRIASGAFELDLKKGEQVILYSGASKPDLTIRPVAEQSGRHNYYGLQ